MRVIAGANRGFRLQTPAGRQTRPTADRVREALFNILSPYVVDSRVLDLFAGSGAVGIEALSRGAALAVLVENSPAAIKAIRSNLVKTGLTGKAEVVTSDVGAAIAYLKRKGQVFDLVFMDPPYKRELITSTLEELAKMDIVAPRGIVVAESSAREAVPETVGRLRCYRRQNYGDTDLIFYTLANSEDDGGILG